MGFFTKLIGMPEQDPTGRSREYFELVGKTAMKMAAQRNLRGALQHIDVFLMNTSSKWGHGHADMGRGKLAKAALLYLGADLRSASTEAQAAFDVLQRNRSYCTAECEAAKDFQELVMESMEAVAGRPRTEKPLESRPFGKWLSGLQM